MNADRIDYYTNQLRGVPVSDLGRKLREVLREATDESRAEENEACAMVCEVKAEKYYDHAKPPYMDCADAIRARRNHG